MSDFKEWMVIIGVGLLAIIGSGMALALFVLAIIAPIALVVYVFGNAIGIW